MLREDFLPSPGKVTGNSEGGGGGGVSKAKIFKGKFEVKLEFSERWVCKTSKKKIWGDHILYSHNLSD